MTSRVHIANKDALKKVVDAKSYARFLSETSDQYVSIVSQIRKDLTNGEILENYLSFLNFSENKDDLKPLGDYLKEQGVIDTPHELASLEWLGNDKVNGVETPFYLKTRDELEFLGYSAGLFIKNQQTFLHYGTLAGWDGLIRNYASIPIKRVKEFSVFEREQVLKNSLRLKEFEKWENPSHYEIVTKDCSRPLFFFGIDEETGVFCDRKNPKRGFYSSLEIDLNDIEFVGKLK